jgi:hypothetical protein
MICACSLPGPRPKRQVHIFRKRRLEEAIHHARLVCTKKASKECAVAWDIVEEISAAENDLKLKDSDQVYDI